MLYARGLITAPNLALRLEDGQVDLFHGEVPMLSQDSVEIGAGEPRAAKVATVDLSVVNQDKQWRVYEATNDA